MAVQPIPYVGPAPRGTDGVLTQFVRVPVDNSPAESNGVITYTEKWKGPYETAKEILSDIQTGDTISYAHQKIGSGRVERYTAPEPPERQGLATEWYVSDIKVQELDAGAHALVTIVYTASYSSSTTSSDVPEQDVWSLSWQSYTVSPWQFCMNDDSYKLTDLVWSPSDTPPAENWDKGANRAYIDKAINSPEWTVNEEFIVYTPNVTGNLGDCRYYLHPANKAIEKKAALNRNAIYHTPVLVHQTATEHASLTATYGSVVGGDIDITCAVPSGCPYSFPSNKWDWIKTGDEMTQSKSTKNGKTTFTRKEVWNGYPHDTIDKNYYGTGTFSHDKSGILSGRWEVGKV